MTALSLALGLAVVLAYAAFRAWLAYAYAEKGYRAELGQVWAAINALNGRETPSAGDFTKLRDRVIDVEARLGVRR